MDCICCGFGAVILLFVMNKGVRKGEIEQEFTASQESVDEVHQARAEAFFDRLQAEMERDLLRDEVAQKQSELKELRAETAKMIAKSAETRAEVPDVSKLQTQVKGLASQLKVAKQELDKKRKIPTPWKADLVGGVQADSEYVIFIIDVSGSMTEQRFGVLDTIRKKLKEILSIYPKAKGFQILTADGAYMADIGNARSRMAAHQVSASPLAAFLGGGRQTSLSRSSSAGSFFAPDAKGRQAVMNAFTNFLRSGIGSLSSPEMGLREAFRAYRNVEGEVGIFLFGDDFSGNAEGLLTDIRSMNANGKFRINAVGFPSILYQSEGNAANMGGAFKYANTMRALTGENGGAFVAASGN